MHRPNSRSLAVFFISIVIILLSTSFTAVAQTPYLLKDINPNVDDGSAASHPDNIVSIGMQLYFLADSAKGTELWRTDGTADVTTTVVKIICPSNCTHSSQRITSVNGRVFFVVRDSSNNFNLWTSDGTSAGTILLKQFTGDWPMLTATGSQLLFSADDGVHGTELWKSDGTIDGTTMLKDICAGSCSGVVAGSAMYFSGGPTVNPALFFAGNDGTNGTELWKSDGTADGTVLFKDICPGSCSSTPAGITMVGYGLFFSANDGVHGNELWRSYGTDADTQLVADINPGAASSNPAQITLAGNTIFFTADDGVHGNELWSYYSSARLYTDVVPGAAGSNISNLTADSYGYIYFTIWQPSQTYTAELWVADGTYPATRLKQFQATQPLKDLTAFAGTVVFSGDDSATSTAGVTLWWVFNQTVSAISSLHYPHSLTPVGSYLYFGADDGINGDQLWSTIGSATSQQMIKVATSKSSGIMYPIDVNGTAFFSASDGIGGAELWKTDGTADGTVMVSDINAGFESSYPAALANVNGTVLFTAIDAVHGRELWRTDGTEEGTTLIKDICPGTTGSSSGYLTNINGKVFMNADDCTHGAELWATDGTESGTYLVKDIYSYGSGYPASLVNLNGTLLFLASDSNPNQIWKSDGTEAGTSRVKSQTIGYANYLTNVNGAVFFTASSSGVGTELWKTDGTDAGTVLVKDIRTGSSSSTPKNLANVNGTLFFTANDGTHGYELWKSDGTSAGTVLVKDIYPGTTGSGLNSGTGPANLTNVNGMLFFTATDGVNGTELWESDGTTAGTVMVKDICSGSCTSSPTNLFNAKGTLYFSANDGVNGTELWKSDGTAAGTVMVADINPGAASSSPTSLVYSNGKLLFAANDGVHGSELWAIDLTPGIAIMTSPYPGTKLTTNLPTFNWTEIPDAALYWIWIGTTPGGMELYNQGQGTNTSAKISGLPMNGSTIYVRLFTYVNDSWLFNDYSYTAFDLPPAVMSDPVSGSTLTESSVTFNWRNAKGATQYWLWVGTTPGGMEIYNQDQSLNSSVTINGLPTDGSTIYVRLFTVLNGRWQWNDYSYIAGIGPTKAAMTSPTAGSTLPGSSVTFAWSPGSGATQYWLWIGTTPGGMELYNQGQALNTSVTINGLPINSSTVYVRLFSVLNGQWQWNDYTYSAASVSKAAMIAPASDATLTGSSATFTWSAGSGATRYWMWIGTTPGGMELYNQGQGLNTSVTVSGLPTNGSNVYVRLFSVLNGAWQWNDYTYAAAVQ